MRLFDRAFQKLIKQGELIVTDVRGREYRYGSPYPGRAPVHVRFTDKSTPRKIVLAPSLGAGEAYMDGRLVVEDGSILDLVRLVTGSNRWEDGGAGREAAGAHFVGENAGLLRVRHRGISLQGSLQGSKV